MRRFGGTDDFLAADRARPVAWRPRPGFRTNVILGFPGETEDDVAELERFLTEGRLDAVGVFGYSDEEGTEAIGLSGKLDQAEIDARVRRITDLVEELTAQRAEDRIGERVEVLLTEDLVGRPRARASGSGTPPTRTPTPTGRRPSPGCPPTRSPVSSSTPRWSTPRASTSSPARWSCAAGPGRAVTAMTDVAPDPAATPAVVGEAGQPAQRADGAAAGRGAGVRGACCCRTAGWTTPAATGPRWSSRWRSSPTATTG